MLGAQYVPAFNLSVIPADPATGHDVFEIAATPDGRVALRGSAGHTLAAGLGWYLKTYCSASWTWGKNGTGLQMRTVPAPSALPLPTGTTRTVSPVIWRYAYNVCTYGYTMAWWDWRQWEEELDRLALWGVNLPLAFAGQESIFLRAFVNAGGLAKEDVTAGFFAGPAFAAWQVSGDALQPRVGGCT